MVTAKMSNLELRRVSIGHYCTLLTVTVVSPLCLCTLTCFLALTPLSQSSTEGHARVLLRCRARLSLIVAAVTDAIAAP